MSTHSDGFDTAMAQAGIDEAAMARAWAKVEAEFATAHPLQPFVDMIVERWWWNYRIAEMWARHKVSTGGPARPTLTTPTLTAPTL